MEKLDRRIEVGENRAPEERAILALIESSLRGCDDQFEIPSPSASDSRLPD
jgi:hypothetical protein